MSSLAPFAFVLLAAQTGMTNKWLAEQGLIFIKEQWVKIHYPATDYAAMYFGFVASLRWVS